MTPADTVKITLALLPPVSLLRTSNKPAWPVSGRHRGSPQGHPNSTFIRSRPINFRSSADNSLSHSRTGSRPLARRKNRATTTLFGDITEHMYHMWCRHVEPAGRIPNAVHRTLCPLAALMNVVRRRRLTPAQHQKKSRHYHPGRRPMCAPNNKHAADAYLVDGPAWHYTGNQCDRFDHHRRFNLPAACRDLHHERRRQADWAKTHASNEMSPECGQDATGAGGQ